MPYTVPEQAGLNKAIIEADTDRMHVSKIVEVVEINGDSLVTVAPVVQKSVMDKYRSEYNEDITPIIDIPVYTGSGGGIAIKPSIAIGDIGTIVHFDADMDEVIVNGNLYVPPYTTRRHNVNDCFFLPGLTEIGGSFNTDGCYEIISESVVFRLCQNGWDVIVNGDSLINALVASNSLPANWGL